MILEIACPNLKPIISEEIFQKERLQWYTVKFSSSQGASCFLRVQNWNALNNDLSESSSYRREHVKINNEMEEIPKEKTKIKGTKRIETTMMWTVCLRLLSSFSDACCYGLSLHKDREFYKILASIHKYKKDKYQIVLVSSESTHQNNSIT